MKARATNAPVLLLHGEPSWSFLYRKMIARLVAQGHRVVAPDLVGFGRSDKPTEREDYTYEAHVKWMSDWLVANDLKNITLFCQDWGGLIGLRLVAAFPERFARVVAGNTFLPAGSGANPAFEAWRTFSQTVPVFPTGNILNGGTVRELSQAEMDAYEAPYPDESYKAGARQFPALVPVSPDMPSVKENKEAWKVLETLREAVPHRLQRSRSDHARRRCAPARTHSRLQRPKAHDDHWRRPFSPGRQARRTR